MYMVYNVKSKKKNRETVKISIKQSPSHSFPPAMQQPTWGQPLLTGVFQIKKKYFHKTMV